MSQHPLTITYRHECDLNQINKKVESLIQGDNFQVARWEAEIKDLQSKIKITPALNQKFALVDTIQKIEKKIREQTSGERLDVYREAVKDLLKSYQALPPVETKIGFGMINKYEKITPERSKILADFFLIAGRFVDIEVFHKVEAEEKCPSCETDIRELSEPANGEVLCCPGCGFNLLPFRDFSSSVPVGDYKDRENFEKDNNDLKR